MLTLLEEVRLKGTLMPFEQYRESYLSEQRASISSLRNEEWHLSRSLRLKVQEDGRYRPFYGDTVIFPLHSAEITNLEKLERQLHERIPESLAEPLVPEQMHLTLHDLSNGPSADDIGERLLSNERQCQRIFGELAAHLANRPEDAHIRLVSALAFPCAGISVVLRDVSGELWIADRWVRTTGLRGRLNGSPVEVRCAVFVIPAAFGSTRKRPTPASVAAHGR